MRTRLMLGLIMLLPFQSPPAMAESAISTFTPEVSYSADSVMQTDGMTISGKIYATPEMERQENTIEGQGTMVMIRRNDLSKLWMLLPEQRMYMEFDVNEIQQQTMGMMERPPNPQDYSIEKTEIGEEVVNGIETTRYRVTLTDQDGGEQMNGDMWMTDDNILVRLDATTGDGSGQNGLRMDRSNIVVGPQDQSLFEIPPGYSSPMQGLNNLMNGLKGLSMPGR